VTCLQRGECGRDGGVATGAARAMSSAEEVADATSWHALPNGTWQTAARSQL